MVVSMSRLLKESSIQPIICLLYTSLRDGVPLGQEEFKKRDNAVKVWVFPRYGMRFHIEKCKYVKMYDKEGSYKLVMDEKDAGLKGFSPCLVCGGAANA